MKNQEPIRAVSAMNPKYNQSYVVGLCRQGMQRLSSTWKPRGQAPQSLHVSFPKNSRPQYIPGHFSAIYSIVCFVNNIEVLKTYVKLSCWQRSRLQCKYFKFIVNLVNYMTYMNIIKICWEIFQFYNITQDMKETSAVPRLYIQPLAEQRGDIQIILFI